MKKKGQTSLEALLLMSAGLALLAVFVSALSSIAEKSLETNQKMAAISDSKQCAALIDAVFANSGGKPKTQVPNCAPKGPHEILVKKFEWEKTAFTLAEKMELVERNGETIIEVKTPAHYQ